MKLKIVFFLITVLVLMQACNEATTSELPILGYNYVDGKKEHYKIEDFKFINQNGDIITSKSTQGKVHTINFFFTTCPSICPPMRIIQMELAKTFSKDKDFKQYSISIDLKNDTLEQLQSYAKLNDINAEEWNLLRSISEEKLEEIANKLKTNFKPNEDGITFYHSSYLALIDKNQYIRGFYDILKPQEVTLLKKDIRTLLEELK